MATRGEMRNELRAWIAELRQPVTHNDEVIRPGLGEHWTDEECLIYIARFLRTAPDESLYPPRSVGRVTADTMRDLVTNLVPALEWWGLRPASLIEPDHDEPMNQPPEILITYRDEEYVLQIAPRYDEAGMEQ